MRKMITFYHLTLKAGYFDYVLYCEKNQISKRFPKKFQTH